MPKKIREFKTQIAREGFIYLPKRGKGSHERWRHPLLGKTLTIPGKDGDDVPLYLENQLKKFLAALEELIEEDENQ
jgi:predicted RNA binding protein YcfA (HicA-like mRNA interferase family)